ncbi:MAG: TonB-dependent receptor [Syntrophothermus sp.]
MKKFLFLLLFIFPVIITASTLISVPDNDSIKTYQTDEIIITGSRTEIEKSRVPASISIISGKSIEQSRQFNILPVLNRRVPGLFIDDRTVMGYGVGSASAGTISIRGISGNPNSRILTLIDGQPQFMGIFGHPVYDQFNSSDVEKVEIIRGPGSILYGSNAMGGTINIITKRQTANGLKLKGEAAYGSFNSKAGSASAGFKEDDYNLYGAVNYASTDGHRSDGDDMFRSLSGFIKGTYTISQSFSLSADGNISNSEFYDPGRDTKPLRGSFYKYDRGRTALSLENNISGIEGALRFYYSAGKHDFYDGWNSTDYISGITFYQNYRVYGSSTVTLGADYKNYGGRGTNNKMPPAAAKGLASDHKAEEMEYYALGRFALTDDVSADAGYRLSKNSLFGWQAVPQFGMTYKPDENSVVKVSAGNAYRNPSILDLYLFPVSNSKLVPEKSRNYEAGVSRFFFGGNLAAEVTFFYISGENLIEEVQAGLIRRKENSGSFIHKGIEAELRYKMAEGLNIYGNYSYLKTQKPVLYAPGNLINLQADYSIGSWSVSAGTKYVSDLYSSLLPEVKENYILVNASAGFTITDGMAVYVKGDNILGRKYQIDSGYPMPGSVWTAGIRMRY